MKYRKILVVYKKPVLDIYSKKSKEVRELLAEGRKMEDLEAEKLEDRITKKVVKPILEADKDIKVDWKYRANLSEELMSKYDLIMTFGGDGTLIDASHYIKDDKPVFGINSDYRPDSPDSSEGFFLSANKHDFLEKYKKLQKGNLKEYKFNRLQFELNDKKLEELVLNDVLVAHKIPGATSRMVVKDKGIEEFKKSDGVIIATAASNWAIQKYGGAILPITSNKISYVTRGLSVGRLNPDPKLETGVTDELKVFSKMRSGMLYVDGQHIIYPFGLGSSLKAYSANKPLTIIGFNEENRKKYYAIKRK